MSVVAVCFVVVAVVAEKAWNVHGAGKIVAKTEAKMGWAVGMAVVAVVWVEVVVPSGVSRPQPGVPRWVKKKECWWAAPAEKTPRGYRRVFG